MSLHQYLKKFKIDGTLSSTHTQIPCHELEVYGGNYHIPDDKMNEFYKVYKKYVFQEKNKRI